MKKQTLLLLLCVTCSLFSQEKEHKLSVNFSYGLSIIDYANSFDDFINLEIPTTGSFIDINLDYKIAENKYLGVGFSRQQHVMNLNQGALLNTDTFLVLDNYRNIHQKDYVDIHFRTEFSNNLNFNMGIFYYFDYLNMPDIFAENNERFAVLFNETNRSDNFGLFIATGYFFQLNTYVRAGANAKLYYSLNGIETIAILPTINVTF
jgi:hypothetical protein